MKNCKKIILFFFLFSLFSCNRLMGPSGSSGDTKPVTPAGWNQSGLIIKANGTNLTNILHDLGETARNTPLTATFTLENNYSVPVNLTGTPVIGQQFTNPYFSIAQPATAFIPAKSSLNFTVTFTPGGYNTSDGSNIFGISIPNDSQTGTISFYIQVNTPWHFLGSPILDTGVNGPFDLKVDSQSGVVYLGFQKNSFSFSFMRHISGSWALLPSINPGNLAGTADSIRLFIENGIVYFAAKKDTSVWVYKYENSTWSPLFNAGAISGLAAPCQANFGFAVYNGIPYLSVDTNNFIKLLVYDPATSSFNVKDFGNALGTVASSPELSLAIQKDSLGNENIYFNYPNTLTYPSANLGIIHCKTNDYTPIASDLKETDSLNNSTIKAFNGEVFLAYLYDNSKNIQLEKWDGSSSSYITLVSGPDSSDLNAKSYLFLNFSKSNAYIAYLTNGKIGIIKQNGSGFSPFGDDSTNNIYNNTDDTAYPVNLTSYDTDGNGNHYIAFRKAIYPSSPSNILNVLSVMTRKD